MSHLTCQRALLGHADRDIAEGERRITCQALRVERMRLSGRDLCEAETLLRHLVQMLEIWRDRRTGILATMARLEATPVWARGQELTAGDRSSP